MLIYTIVIKFLTKFGVREIQSNLREFRECYLTSLRILTKEHHNVATL